MENRRKCLTDNYENSYGKRRRFFKRKSRQILYGDWLTHVFAFLMIGAVYFGIVQFGASVSLLTEELTGNAYISMLLFSIFFVLCYVLFVPLITGIVYFENGCLENGKARLSDVFYAFENTEKLARSYKILLFAAVKSVLYFLPSLMLDYFLENVYFEGIFGKTSSYYGQDAVYLLLSVLLVIFITVGIVLSAKNVVGVYVSTIHEDKSVSQCFFIAKLCVTGSKRELTLLVISFVPIMLLSLFTLGFLFVIYTFPYLALCVTMFSKYLYEKEMNSKSVMKMMYSSDENAE